MTYHSRTKLRARGVLYGKSLRFAVQLPPAYAKALQEKAAQDGVPVASLIRLAIVTWLGLDEETAR